MNTINETFLQTKRLELLRNYFHSCLRGDCLPKFQHVCKVILFVNIFIFFIYSLLLIYLLVLIIKVSRGIEPLNKVLTVPRNNHSAITPYIYCIYVIIK
jgi:hypothetical protein